MRKNVRPAVDPAVVSAYGTTRDGQPLSYNRAPAADLVPWVGRFYATKITLPEGYELKCGVFDEAAMLRLQLSGNWKAQTSRGLVAFGKAPLMFFPQARRMPVSVTGSFISIGQSLRPGSAVAFAGLRLADRLGEIMMPDEVGEPMVQLCNALDPKDEPETWIVALEHLLRNWIRDRGSPEPDPISARLEIVAFTNPRISVAQFAEQCALSERTIERTVLRDFGMSPKQVLRRARALDMASILRGVADTYEADELTLRYYDQSHLIREFTDLFGMSPRQFAAAPQPLMTLALESRQARRLEVLDRIAPGAKRPWE